MSEKVTQSLVVLVVRHDLSLEEGALSCRESLVGHGRICRCA
jgi:hypothetical protein